MSLRDDLVAAGVVTPSTTKPERRVRLRLRSNFLGQAVRKLRRDRRITQLLTEKE